MTQDNYTAYDSLPTELRQFLQQTVMNWESSSVSHQFYGRFATRHPLQLAMSMFMREMLMAEQNEMKDFANNYQRRYGHDYPHRAAGATIQRYANYKKRRRV